MKIVTYCFAVFFILNLSTTQAACPDYYGTNSDVEKLICSDKELFSLHREFTKLYESILASEPEKIAVLELQKKLLDENLYQCSYDHCVQRAYIQRNFVLSTLKTPKEKIFGIYKQQVSNCYVDGSCYDDIEDVITVRDESGSIKVEMSLTFFNGHQCSFGGTAEWLDGILVAQDDHNEDSICTIYLYLDGDTIVTEVDPKTSSICKSYCGLRGSLNGIKVRRAN